MQEEINKAFEKLLACNAGTLKFEHSDIDSFKIVGDTGSLKLSMTISVQIPKLIDRFKEASKDINSRYCSISFYVNAIKTFDTEGINMDDILHLIIITKKEIDRQSKLFDRVDAYNWLMDLTAYHTTSKTD